MWLRRKRHKQFGFSEFISKQAAVDCENVKVNKSFGIWNSEFVSGSNETVDSLYGEAKTKGAVLTHVKFSRVQMICHIANYVNEIDRLITHRSRIEP